MPRQFSVARYSSGTKISSIRGQPMFFLSHFLNRNDCPRQWMAMWDPHRDPSRNPMGHRSGFTVWGLPPCNAERWCIQDTRLVGSPLPAKGTPLNNLPPLSPTPTLGVMPYLPSSATSLYKVSKLSFQVTMMPSRPGPVGGRAASPLSWGCAWLWCPHQRQVTPWLTQEEKRWI